VADGNTLLRFGSEGTSTRGKAAIKTSGTERFYSLFLLNFDQFYQITFNPLTPVPPVTT